MTDYAKCFDTAVEVIDRTAQFPGQIIPGMWDINTRGMVPAVIIGVIIADAVAAAARECGLVFDFVMSRYERLMADQPLEVRGSPDQIARIQLLKAAALDRAHAHRSGETAQISLEDAAETALKYLEDRPEASAFAQSLRVALEASRKSHD